MLVRGGEFRYMVYSYRDSGYLFADMLVCYPRSGLFMSTISSTEIIAGGGGRLYF